MDKLKINRVKIEEKRIDVFFTTSKEAKKYFSKEKHFWIEYSVPIVDVPIGIALIPFICSVLPTVWIANIDLILPEIDKIFYESIDKIKRGYIDMYPNISFKGKISADCVIDYAEDNRNEGCALFFSGGVDAFSSLIAHIEEKPDLLTIWGADVALNDAIGWNNVQTHIHETGKKFGLNAIEIKSNFRSILNPKGFEKQQSKWNYNYWGYLQHGIGIIGHSVPYAFFKGYSTVYIASSFSPHTRQNHSYAWASDPQIDNYVHFAGTKVAHDLGEYSRQDKVNIILNFFKSDKRSIPLRVCWESIGGKNCCKCEKCYRTIMGIIASGGNPNDFGFGISNEDFKKIERYIIYKAEFDWVKTEFWLEIQEEMKHRKYLPQYESSIKWIFEYDFAKVNNSFFKKNYVLSKKICRKFSYILKNI